MKYSKVAVLILFCLIRFQLMSQNVQLHYDFRHTIDPELHPENFPSISFEYYHQFDSIGSFLFKVQSDLNGNSGNMGQTFLQLSQTIKFWKPEVYLSGNFNGGLGIAYDNFGYYISNGYGLGIAHPFVWRGAIFTLNTQYRYTAFAKPSHDIQVTFYVWKGLLNYRLVIAGGIVSWTQNRNQGTAYTSHLSGKKFVFFGDPQAWFRLWTGFSLGTRINLYYNIYGKENELKIYPTLGVQYKF